MGILVLQVCLAAASSTGCGSDRDSNRGDPTGSAGNGGVQGQPTAGAGGVPGGGGSGGGPGNGGFGGGSQGGQAGLGGAPSNSASVQIRLQEVH
jgi:hypothetical protein